MIEGNNIDNLFKSALENAQEEVPEQVWEGISSSLDRLGRRRRIVIALGRIATGMAVAAALVVGVLSIFRYEDGDIVPKDAEKGLIAVVEESAAETPAVDKPAADESVPERSATKGPAHESHAIDDILADNHTSPIDFDLVSNPQESLINQEIATEAPKKEADSRNALPEKEETKAEAWTPIVWEESRPARGRKARVSLTISGLTAMADNKPNPTPGMMKRPSIGKVQKETGISEGSGNGVFGFPVSIGAGVKIDFTPRWSISAGMRYTLLTRKFYGTYNYVSEDGLSDRSEVCDIKNTQHFIGIPIQASFNIIASRLINFYVHAGGAAEKCVDNNYLMLGSHTIYRENVKGLQFSVDAGLGLEVMAGKYIGIYLDPSVRYYFDNSQPKSLRTYQPVMFGIEAGLRIHLYQ